MTEQAKKSKKRTSLLTMLVIAILIALVGVQLIHLRSQIDDARTEEERATREGDLMLSLIHI